MGVIDFNKVIAYSKTMCYDKSRSKCATFVKKAFERGGCKYISGDGWNNQKWCLSNDFVLIGDFVPVGKNPRPHDGRPIQFPAGYVQQMGDVCLIKHGEYGHMCYAMGSGINDWVSDYFQRPPGQMEDTGPYCYKGNIERVQFWRHKSVLNNAPVIQTQETVPVGDEVVSRSDEVSSAQISGGVSNNVMRLSSAARNRDKVFKSDDARKKEFETLVNSMTNDAPKMGREIIVSGDMFDANILKGQESRKERV